jgi:hypothetical protein
VSALVAAVVTARAAALGRAPVLGDVDAALVLLDLDDESATALAGIAHDHGRLRARVAAIAPDRLTVPLGRLAR